MADDEDKKIDFADIENFDEEAGILTLATPIKWTDEEPITELRVRRPSAEELRSSGKNKKEGDVLLLSKLTGKPVLFLGKLDCYDYVNLNKVVVGFTENSPKTGRNGSDI